MKVVLNIYKNVINFPQKQKIEAKIDEKNTLIMKFYGGMTLLSVAALQMRAPQTTREISSHTFRILYNKHICAQSYKKR